MSGFIEFCVENFHVRPAHKPMHTNFIVCLYFFSISLSPTYVTPQNFDFVKPPKDTEFVALDASRLEFMEKQMTENHYESLYDKVTNPSSEPNASEEQNNFSDNNTKPMDKQINLPISLPNDDDDDNSAYDEFQFDEDKDD